MSRIINNTSKLYALSFSVLILTGCATATYVEPTEPAPALWQGSFGIKLAQGEWDTIPGKHGEESAFAITDVENIRTAVLETPLTFEDVSKMGYTSKTKTLPIGTPLYARQYTRHVTTTYGYGSSYTKTQSALRKP
ncbi:MAG: hypothetical protein L3J65_07415, partial [Robiginitomaculum sp.]|nr:hypothetical protein [Robiginitomaculum sp.]